METMRKLPIGMQSFVDLRKKDFVYVDKTEYIFWLANASKVYFLSRPRRFGKSLFLSTLKAYFLGQKELFTGLKIAELEESQAGTRDIWQEYPVLYLDFNTGIYNSPEALLNRILAFLQKYEAIYSSSGLDIPDRFGKLIQYAYEKTGKQVVILVDEYDKPLLETMHDDPELNEIYRKILKGFYGVIKSS
ncbi:MAG: AAA family ATPase, partial [Treponema sp.]